MTSENSSSFIKFSKIENASIFTNDFNTFTERNTISFSKEGMAIIYGPNGTGKTSLVKALAGVDGTKVEFNYCGVPYTSGSDVFAIINDQNHRNIIQGSAKDFLIGANIQREYELQSFIESEYLTLCKQAITELKDRYLISTITHKLFNYINNKDVISLLKALVNNRNKGTSISIDKFIQTIQSIIPTHEINYDDRTLKYYLNDVADKNSLIMSVLAIKIPGIKKIPKIRELEENTAAIEILEKFRQKTQCIVCDTPDIDTNDLIIKKNDNKNIVISTLSKEVQKLIEDVIALATENNPFSIKESLISTLDTGDAKFVIKLQENLILYGIITVALIEQYLVTLLNGSKLEDAFKEYQILIHQKPDITEEDFLYIEEIISGSMRKELKIDRDEKKNIKIFLSNNEFLGHDRNDLQLSSGEQNFLSLTFEFLRARNAPQPIVVLDDPISSFDSIYKNKVVYAIAKILENKKRIIMMHNIDMIRLLDAQYKKSFKMYLLNNTDNEINGFIPLKYAEQDMLINLSDLLNSFRKKVLESVIDSNLYLMSMIPFMRGYANICNKKSVYEALTKVMHGYMSESIDIALMYHELFDSYDDDGNKTVCLIVESYVINVDEILKLSVDGHDIIDTNIYPLLNRTLKHTFIYLSLRLIVERTLTRKYCIDTTKYSQLGQIIDQAFNRDTDESKRMRVKLTSKKTLINEFNHFEGNLSIFQPAIDITDTALGKEKIEVLSLVERIKRMRD